MRGPFVYSAEEADNFPLLDGFQADCARGIEEEAERYCSAGLSRIP
jgi:hypothetical protein